MDKALRAKLCPKVSCQLGAPMGRPEASGERVWYFPVRDVLVPINRSGCDQGGAYWGVGQPLRCRFQLDECGRVVWKEFYRGNKKGGQQQ